MLNSFKGWLFGKNKQPTAPPRSPQGHRPLPAADLPFAVELDATEDAIYRGELIFATSSNVEEWRYIGRTKDLYVRFKSGGLYLYPGVPFPVAVAFFKTDSPGRFVHWHLKGKYGERKVGEMEPMPHANVVTTID